MNQPTSPRLNELQGFIETNKSFPVDQLELYGILVTPENASNSMDIVCEVLETDKVRSLTSIINDDSIHFTDSTIALRSNVSVFNEQTTQILSWKKATSGSSKQLRTVFVLLTANSYDEYDQEKLKEIFELIFNVDHV